MNIEIAPKETEIQANWEDAKRYCEELVVNGKTGWRLPTKEELDEIDESQNDFEKWFYWSSSEFDDNGAWGQYFDDGSQYTNDKSGIFNARAIRDI